MNKFLKYILMAFIIIFGGYLSVCTIIVMFAYLGTEIMRIILGLFAIICGILWILKKDKLKRGWCKDWKNSYFYIFGSFAILSGIILLCGVDAIRASAMFIPAITMVFFALTIIAALNKRMNTKKMRKEAKQHLAHIKKQQA